MSIKIENRSSLAVKGIEEQIQAALDCVPIEHLRGFGRIVLVDQLDDPRLTKEQIEGLPVLYHPKTPGSSTAFGELALTILLPKTSVWKNFLARAQFKANLANFVLMIVAQHYFITLSTKKKKGDIVERALREYVAKYFVVWRDRQRGFRARLFKPLVPYLERWQKSIQRRYAGQERKKSKSTP